MEHLHYRALSILREIVTSLPNFSVEKQSVCIGCARGNNAKVAFPSSESRSKGILDLVHSDVSGPMSMASVQGALNYVAFIHKISKKT
jgi:hypothetical protein